MAGGLPKIVCFVGPSGSGKTTLIEKLIPVLRGRGLRVGVIKNDAHKFQIDTAGKDSDRFFQAGADGVVIQSPSELAFRIPQSDRRDPADLVHQFFSTCDLLLVEGASWSSHPKTEVWRQRAHPERLTPPPEPLLAVVTDEPASLAQSSVPVFDLDDISQLSDFLEK